MDKKKDSACLFNDFEDFTLWKKEWKDMPEFAMKRLEPFFTIKLHFRSQKDIDDFSKLINQKVRHNCENYWYPKLNIKTNSEQKYVDES